MKKLCVVLLLTIACSSCDKDKIRHKVKFEGRVTDRFTRYPVQNASIYIFQHYHVNGPSIDDEQGPWSTDADGNFNFKSENMHRNPEEFYMRFLKLPAVSEYLWDNRIPLSDVENEEYMDVQLFTHARLQFVFMNTTPFDQNDQVSDIYIERPWGQQKFAEGDTVLNGTTVNATITSTFYGYSSSVLHYTVRKNNVSQQYTDTVFTPDPFAERWDKDTILY